MNELSRMLGLSVGGFFLALFVVWLVSSIFLWLGAKMAGIDKPGFGQAMLSMAASVIGALLCSLILPGLGTIIGFFVGLGLSKAVFKTTWWRAFLAWFSATLLAGFLVGGALGVLAARSGQQRNDRIATIGMLNNLRGLAAARDQYFLENPNAAAVKREELVGPDKFIRQLNSVRGEIYPETYRREEVLIARDAQGRELQRYGP